MPLGNILVVWAATEYWTHDLAIWSHWSHVILVSVCVYWWIRTSGLLLLLKKFNFIFGIEKSGSSFRRKCFIFISSSFLVCRRSLAFEGREERRRFFYFLFRQTVCTWKQEWLIEKCFTSFSDTISSATTATAASAASRSTFTKASPVASTAIVAAVLSSYNKRALIPQWSTWLYLGPASKVNFIFSL